jgi:hypothetical protein
MDDHAEAYRRLVHAAKGAGIAAKPEAQLTHAVPMLLGALAEQSGLGAVQFVGETQLESVEPDFGILIDERFVGWLELKAPGTGVYPENWKGPHNKKQWLELAGLDNLLICDGRFIRHFSDGKPQSDPLALPYDGDHWDADAVAAVLRAFSVRNPKPIRSASELATALAPMATALRRRIHECLTSDDQVPAVVRAKRIWNDLLSESVDDAHFADALAQVITYGLVIATLDGAGDTDSDGIVSIEEAEESLERSHTVLAATMRPVLDVEGLREALRNETGALERLLGAVDVDAVTGRKDPRGDPWLWFYEDFLDRYDPDARKDAGVYYTPIPVVECIVRLAESVLVNELGLALGFGSEEVVTLDPACGTGTFPLAVLDSAASRAAEQRGPAGPSQVAQGLAERLLGFEILPGPFAVAHLRLGERLQGLGADLPRGGARILLADTLDSPTETEDDDQLALFGPAQVLAAEKQRARAIKREQRVMAILGNPPYDRVKRNDVRGGWVVLGDAGSDDPVLLDDVLAAATERDLLGEIASLYNLYVYFWRWAIWKAFEQDDGPAVIGFITASSWLSGQGFVGLRELVAREADEVWIVDLGGDSRGGKPDENVFAIERPVAITVMFRSGEKKPGTPARVLYRRIEGKKRMKLDLLSQVEPPAEDPEAWTSIELDNWLNFSPESGDSDWADFSDVDDLFPLSISGVKYRRTWPISPDRKSLLKRWKSFLSDRDSNRRSILFPDAETGRTVHTEVRGMPRLVDLPKTAEPRPFARYNWKPFDRQWTFEDPRLAELERPFLWQAVGPEQVFLTTPSRAFAIGAGPAAHVTGCVPDLNSFRGSASSAVIPLYRDAGAKEPNVTAGLPASLKDLIGLKAEPSPEEILAYTYFVLANPRYQERFAEQLSNKVIRIPITANPELWTSAVAVGEELVWLHTFGERFADKTRGRTSRLPPVSGLEWELPVTTIPASRSEIQYDEDTEQLRIGDGLLVGVPSLVWNLRVSGWPVVQRWLEGRTASGRGRVSSELDEIRPDRWSDEWNDELLQLVTALASGLSLLEEHDALLEAIIAGELVPSNSLPKPAEEESAVPEAERAQADGDSADQLTIGD